MPRRRVGGFRSDAARAHYLSAYRSAMAAMPQVSETVDVPTTFGTVRAYRFDGPPDVTPVVLLPGRNAAAPMWRTNLAWLTEHRTVVAIDLLGEAGLSVQHAPVSGPDDEAQWLDETLAGLRLENVHLMGVSIGGWTATNGALRRPGRIASVVLLDPVLTFSSFPFKALALSPFLLVPAVPDAMRRWVLRWISGGADVDGALPETALIAAGSTDFVLRKAAPRRIPEALLRSLDVPVLALLAGRSVMHDATRAAASARKVLPHAHVEVWPDASHAINGEYPAAIAEAAATFWREI